MTPAVNTVADLITQLQALDPTSEVEYLVVDSDGAIALMDLSDNLVDMPKLLKSFKKPKRLKDDAPTRLIAVQQVPGGIISVRKRQDSRYDLELPGGDLRVGLDADTLINAFVSSTIN